MTPAEARQALLDSLLVERFTPPPTQPADRDAAIERATDQIKRLRAAAAEADHHHRRTA